MNEAETFIDLLSKIVKDGTDETFEIDGAKFRIKKTKDKFEISGEEVKTCDESKICEKKFNEKVAKFKNMLESLDDCFFMNVVDEVKDEISTKKLDYLLDTEAWTQDEVKLLDSWIDKIEELVCKKLSERITHYQELFMSITQ